MPKSHELAQLFNLLPVLAWSRLGDMFALVYGIIFKNNLISLRRCENANIINNKQGCNSP